MGHRQPHVLCFMAIAHGLPTTLQLYFVEEIGRPSKQSSFTCLPQGH